MSKQVTKHKSRRLRRFLKANEAVSALEYAILVGVIAIGVGGAAILFGGQIEKTVNKMSTQVQNVRNTLPTAPF